MNPNAFPRPFSLDNVGNSEHAQDGMTLRDYFAAKAMAAMIGTAAGPCLSGLDGMETNSACAAYRMADAMLTARNSQ